MEEKAREKGYRYLIAVILGVNHRSIQLFEKADFSLWGTFPEVVWIAETKIDHLYFGKKI